MLVLGSYVLADLLSVIYFISMMQVKWLIDGPRDLAE